MKSKFLTKALGLILSAAVVLTNLPISASAAQESSAIAVETKKSNSEKDVIEDIFTFNWKTASEEEINDAVYAASEEDLGAWLKSMSEAELNELLSKNTYLHNATTVTDYSVDEEGVMTPIKEDSSMEYYEYALSKAPKNAKLNFNNASGGYYYTFNIDGILYRYRMNISGLSKNTKASTQQKVSLALVIPSGVPAWLEFRSNAGTSSTERKLQPILDTTSKTPNYTTLRNGVNFTKPAGYMCSYETAAQKSKIYYYDDGTYEDASKRRLFGGSNNTLEKERYNLLAYVHMNDAGIATTASDGKVSDGNIRSFHFNLTPTTYYIDYNPNGATGGSMSRQTCVYDKSYTPSANGFSRSYEIIYNANGGTTTKTKEKVDFAFSGWGWENTTTVTHTDATPFANVTPVHGGLGGTFYAIWEPKATNLAIAERNGYTFTGWLNDADNQVRENGASYTPYVSSTMIAQWVPNTYSIKFDSDGGTECADVVATYDADCELPITEKAGYTFKGWTDGVNTYSGTVKNLTAEAAGVITLKAVWEAKADTPYTIVHLIQKALSSDEYIEYEVEVKTGTTGSSVIAPVKQYEGYISPSPETQIIKGDGSTRFEYKYKLPPEKNVTYKVEHYLQNVTDKTQYELIATEKHMVEEGSFVTPAIITTYQGYDIPDTQTVQVYEGTVVKYYYRLSAVAPDNHIGESEGDVYGDINNFKAGDVKYYTDEQGNEYEIYVNADGTLTVRKIKPSAKSEKTLTIKDTIMVNGVKYQIKEIAPYAFKNNKKIETVKIGNGITKIGKGAFQGCTKLKKVTFGAALSVIGTSAFQGCKNLETVKTNKSLTKVGSKAFYNCKKLKSFSIGKYVKTIGSYAFSNCKQLKKITIAESMEIIEKKAFYGCKNLKNVNIKSAKLVKVGSKAFKKCKKNIVFTVPAKKKKTYMKLLKNKY